MVAHRRRVGCDGSVVEATAIISGQCGYPADDCRARYRLFEGQWTRAELLHGAASDFSFLNLVLLVGLWDCHWFSWSQTFEAGVH